MEALQKLIDQNCKLKETLVKIECKFFLTLDVAKHFYQDIERLVSKFSCQKFPCCIELVYVFFMILLKICEVLSATIKMW